MCRALMRLLYLYFLFIINPSPLLAFPSFPLFSNIRCHEDESSALLAFRNSMSIQPYSYFYLRSWKNGSDCCEWQGVLCDDTTHHVVELDLSEAGLVGKLDSNSSLFLLRHLRSLDLSFNDFSNSPISPKFGMFPLLKHLYLLHSNFSGEVPLEIAQLSKLESLWLGSNNEKLKMSNFNTIIANMTELTYLSLHSVNIDSTFPPSLTNLSSALPSTHAQSHLNQLSYLRLIGCNLHGPIPAWIWNISIHTQYNAGLQFLDLSSNSFSGHIDTGNIFSKIQHHNGTSILDYLDLSHNYLTGSINSLPWSTLTWVDLSYNKFEGPLPIPPIYATWFSISNNKFTGPLHSSLCNLTQLRVLDLSNNNVNDEFPHCLMNTSDSLNVLNFASNSIYGTLPATFPKCSGLEFLDLSNNWLHGIVPQSLSHCNNLQLLNLKSNKLRDEFPHWIGSLSNIKVLDLSSNNLYGSVSHPKVNHPFSSLQILDLSSNNFSGKIMESFIRQFKSMMEINEYTRSPQYMKNSNGTPIYYTITLTFNGEEIKYEKIITSLFIIDLSNNKFEGEMPDNIGRLVAIHGLNLSHNQLTGPIPPSLGKLTLLNSLDLSSNKLTGQIPQELASMDSMGFFNVSKNQLVGPIPDQLTRFPMGSYEGNPQLCGLPLKECGGDGRSKQSPSLKEPKEDDSEDISILSLLEWKIIMMGCGSGIIVGFAWGYYMLWVSEPFWLVKLVHLMVLATNGLLEGRFTRRKRGSVPRRS